MIRKLKSGEYRIYSRKPDAKTGRRRNLGTFETRAGARSMSAKSRASSIGVKARDVPAQRRPERIAQKFLQNKTCAATRPDS
jgi:hypothetical protein